MKLLTVIGEINESIQYTERPTVKVIIKNNDKVLILNDGLLPGGGIDDGETNQQAITLELLEELGATVSNIQDIGQVTQYRNFLNREYKVYGYIAQFEAFTDIPTPQDAGEAAFVYYWMTIDDALRYVTKSIAKIKENNPEVTDDTVQGALYNRMTTLELLKTIR